MPVNSHDFLGFAKDCHARADEIGYRNAIGRAYYSSYHHVLPTMANGPKDSHQGLIDYLHGDACRGHETYDPKYMKGIGFILTQLKAQRIIADYRLDQQVSAKQSGLAIGMAERLIDKCSEMTKSIAS
ncbi:hypothetical protein [Lelliottia amnigena]|uniref:hypothetical protein n=1 Tax=Lelliottia amnigena TaxID=61646 RepID=UPI00192BCA56|nr:hypothetical protein [Lelliottia amnigena]MBL5932263.1 hypothetical protein [Lelliottia amnigena]